MVKETVLTFEEGCNKYLENCRQRNLREGTINHYKQSYKQFYKFFKPDMPVKKINAEMYKDFVLYLRAKIHNDVSINSYLRDLITTLHFFMNEGWLSHFKMQAIKVDKSNIETYSEAELKLLLKKPNIKKCSFAEYQCLSTSVYGVLNKKIKQKKTIHTDCADSPFRLTLVRFSYCFCLVPYLPVP